MNKNIWSLGLLRNGKVYANKQIAEAALTNANPTNDGVAKLARYLEDGVIRTLVGFYANASEMEIAGGGQSSYTILDIDGIAGNLDELKDAVDAINEIIGSGIDGTTLTAAINDINDRLGSGFTANHTVADAINELETELTNALTVTLTVAGTPTEGYLKTYVLSQGGSEVGKIDIPKDMVVSGGSLVHGYWNDDTFTEDPDGPDSAIKIEFANADTIYINTKDLVDFYTAGNAAIGIDNDNNTISLVLDEAGEPFLTISENGLKLDGVQAAINRAIIDGAYSAGDGISIAAKTIKAVAAKYSAPAINNPITVDEEGIKFAQSLDCGYYDNDETTVIANNASDITNIENPSETDVFINGDAALDALATKKTFKNLEIANVDADEQVYLSAENSISMDNVDVTGDKGSSNGYFLYDAKDVEVSNITVADGAQPYNVFEGSQTVAGDSFKAANITVDDVALKHNVFNIYKVNDEAVIKITDGLFNLDVNNSNVLRLSNLSNATGVTVEFENIDWTYENTPNIGSADWAWAGLIIYQPFSTDAGAAGDLTAMQTWNFKFKNCRYNGVKVNANNFGEHSQVFYLYNVTGLSRIADPVANGFTHITFE